MSDKGGMTPERLAEIGQAVFGPEWVKDMASAYGVSTRFVRYWKVGEKIPAWATRALEDGYQLEMYRRQTGTTMAAE